MNANRLLILPFALAVGLAQADSFTSSASSAASQSVGSLSNSISASSQSSGGDGKVAAGAYRVTTVARVDGDHLRLELAPADGQAQGFALTLPTPLVQAQGLQPGAALWVAERPYGLAFAAKPAAAPFYLAVAEELRRDFESVKL